MGNFIVSKFFVQLAGIFTIVDDIDDCIVQSCSWGLTGRDRNYLSGNYGKYKWQYLHLIIAKRMSLVSDEIDHTDMNTFNNQRLNLRGATHSQNNMNRKIYSNNITGYKCVTKVGNKYQTSLNSIYI